MMSNMKESLVRELLSVNRQLYTEFAEPFVSTRFREQPGYHRLIHHVPPLCTLLDIGCGNGRWAKFLDEQEKQVHYVGVDFSPQMIALAQQQATRYGTVQTQFVVADVAKPLWTNTLPQLTYNVVTALAVLHHLPGIEHRQAVVRQVHDLLLPGGLFMFSTWLFTEAERMRRKIVSWDMIGVDEQEVEPGDYLLNWHAGGNALRYCHLVDEQEVEDLASTAGFDVLVTFRSDGREGDLSLYAVLRRKAEQ